MRHSIDDRGMALIGVLITLALLMSLAVALAVSVNSDTQLRGAFGSTATGFYAAESGLNKGMAEYRNIFLSYNVPSGDDFMEKSFEISGREVLYQLEPASWMMTDCEAGQQPPCPRSVTIPAGQVFAGLNELQYNYTVKSKAINGNGDIEASVGAEFIVGYIPLFQCVAFYSKDLEILPGPSMTLNGRVHTNANLYLGSGNGLQIVDNPAAGVTSIQVSAGEDIYRGRKNQSGCTGTVTVDMNRDTVSPFGDQDPRDLPCSGSGTRLVPTAELAQWLGNMLSRVESIAIPEPDIIERGSGTYWREADLRIVLNVTGAVPSIEVQDEDGNLNGPLTARLLEFMSDTAWNTGTVPGRGPSSFPNTYPIFYTDIPVDCSDNNNRTCYAPDFASNNRIYTSNMITMDAGVPDFRRGGFYNHRERSWMLLLNVNVRDLLLWNDQNGSPFFSNTDDSQGGLVIFLSVQGPDSSGQNNYGVRVFGSANLSSIPGGIGVSTDPTGLTVVSDQALYVLGDYNSVAPRQPAALIGDSVNVLSNNYWRTVCTDPCSWNDSQSVVALNNSRRDAATTAINAAFLGGVDDTVPGGGQAGYNGGLENYPRFHEDWGGRDLNYQGSFISLGTPKHVDGLWCGTGGACTGAGCSTPSNCNIYNPPRRNWNYDPAFNNAANLPPLTPRFVYVQQVLFTEDFK